MKIGKDEHSSMLNLLRWRIVELSKFSGSNLFHFVVISREPVQSVSKPGRFAEPIIK